MKINVILEREIGFAAAKKFLDKKAWMECKLSFFICKNYKNILYYFPLMQHFIKLLR